MEEPIKIVGFTETIDNCGRTVEGDEQETFRILSAPEEWTDDIVFNGPAGHQYHIDDLIGKNVQVGNITFKIQED